MIGRRRVPSAYRLLYRERSSFVDVSADSTATHCPYCALQCGIHLFNEADGPLFKIREDPRLTRVGAFLRRTSLDELPQLLNVLRGEMSLVGPRPPVPSEVACYQPWHMQRLSVPGGMTGLWQVSGRSDLAFDEMALLDICYIEHWSPWLDLQILLRTLPKVLLAKGAY